MAGAGASSRRIVEDVIEKRIHEEETAPLERVDGGRVVRVAPVNETLRAALLGVPHRLVEKPLEDGRPLGRLPGGREIADPRHAPAERSRLPGLVGDDGQARGPSVRARHERGASRAREHRADLVEPVFRQPVRGHSSGPRPQRPVEERRKWLSQAFRFRGSESADPDLRQGRSSDDPSDVVSRTT